MQQSVTLIDESTQADEGIWLVVYDLDKTLTIEHTRGDESRKWFEEPHWRNNIRCIDVIRTHLVKMRRHCQLAIGTFGWWHTRVEGYWQELWLEQKDLIMHAKLVDPNRHPKQGKNRHIAECLLQHYEKPNAKNIKGVLLVDDTRHNLYCLKNYRHYVEKYYNNDKRLLVPVKSIHMPASRCYEITNKDGEKTLYETDSSREDFVKTLVDIEYLCLPEAALQPATAPQLSQALDLSISSSQELSEDSSSMSQSTDEIPHELLRRQLTKSIGCAHQVSQARTKATPLKSDRHQLIRSQ